MIRVTAQARHRNIDNQIQSGCSTGTNFLQSNIKSTKPYVKTTFYTKVYEDGHCCLAVAQAAIFVKQSITVTCNVGSTKMFMSGTGTRLISYY